MDMHLWIIDVKPGELSSDSTSGEWFNQYRQTRENSAEATELFSQRMPFIKVIRVHWLVK